MECFNCKTTNAPCYYSPKELSKYNIFFCGKCINQIKNIDMRYYISEEHAKKELKIKGIGLWK